MNLYLIQFDAMDYYVEAQDFPTAIEVWKVHVAKLWGDDYDGTEQPESVALVHDEPVLRDELGVRVESNEAIEAAIKLAVRCAGIDSALHKGWVLDQMVRALAGDRYEQIVADAKAGEDGPDTYSWSEGIPP